MISYEISGLPSPLSRLLCEWHVTNPRFPPSPKMDEPNDYNESMNLHYQTYEIISTHFIQPLQFPLDRWIQRIFKGAFNIKILIQQVTFIRNTLN